MIRRTFMGISLMSILNLGNSKEISKENKASKALVIYFSRNGMNYWHGETKNLSVGNTARMAKVIQEATSADVWEIQPVHSYPFDYRQTTAEAQKEQEVDARPEIKLSMPDLAQYDLIFFGHPIWWSEMPMVARTFLDKADLSGKKITHFCTHEGSGFGGSESDLKSRQPRAIYLPSLAIAGTQVDNSTKAIQDWAKKVIKEGESK